MFVVNKDITNDVLVNSGFHKHWSHDMTNCDWYMWLNNSRLLVIYQGEAKQYKVKQIGSREYCSFECTEVNFIKTKVVKDLIHRGILIEE